MTIISIHINSIKFDSYNNIVLFLIVGLAIKKSEMTRWLESSNCSPPPDNCFYCPLCLAAVPDDNEPWRVHLLYDCVGNGRVR